MGVWCGCGYGCGCGCDVGVMCGCDVGVYAYVMFSLSLAYNVQLDKEGMWGRE